MEQPVLPELPISGDSTLKILALGDSYTKGESVAFAKNFPNQLTDSLQADGWQVGHTRIIAQTGWRTDDLQAAIAGAQLQNSIYDVVTLCIGVNNQYQNGNINTYKAQFEQLLQTALARAGNRKERVFVLSIPDWAFTPDGQKFNKPPEQISQEIDQFNQVNRSITEQYGIQYVDVTDVSRRGLAQPNLVAADELHPSAVQYTEWVQLLLPFVREALNK